MALKPVDNETFYREVDEELRKEQLSSTWQRYGRWIVLGVVLLLAGIAGFLYWQQQQEAKRGQQAETLTALFEDVQRGQTKTVQPKLDELAREGSDGYRAAALLTKADIAVQQGNDAAALAAFQQVTQDEGLPEPYRELALIRRTAIEYDKLAPTAVIERLRPLAVAGSPWFGSAGEMVALAHLKAGRPQEAARIFAALAKDEKVPGSIRSRSVQMAGALGIDAVQQGTTKEAN